LPISETLNIVSVGRYALRGVSHLEELFTVDFETAILAKKFETFSNIGKVE
jgi:hypothetical protein